jgi:hypothetical protein
MTVVKVLPYEYHNTKEPQLIMVIFGFSCNRIIAIIPINASFYDLKSNDNLILCLLIKHENICLVYSIIYTFVENV